MKTKHTPGPWKATVAHERSIPIETDDGQIPIASVFGYRASSDETTANARLIAAAPELLEALQEASAGLLEWMSDHNDETDETDDNLLAKIAAAIRSATEA